jgi:hypothetical protein
MCVLFHSFYCVSSCYLPSTQPSLRYLNSCSESDMGSFSQRKFRVSVEGEMSTPKGNESRGATRLRPVFHIVQLVYKWYPPNNLFADDTCLYAIELKEGYVLRKLQRGLNSIAVWCGRWNIKINEDKSQAIYFSHRIRPPEFLLTFNGRNIQFVSSLKYLGGIFWYVSYMEITHRNDRS